MKIYDWNDKSMSNDIVVGLLYFRKYLLERCWKTGAFDNYDIKLLDRLSNEVLVKTLGEVSGFSEQKLVEDMYQDE